MAEIFKSFGIEWKILIWQVINFGLLFAALSYFFYKPVKKLMSEREGKIADSLKNAENLEKKSKELEVEFKKKMTEQRMEIEEMHKKAKSAGDELRKELKAKAESESSRVIEEARKTANQEKAEILKSLEDEVKGLAITLASKVLERNIDEKTERKFMEEALGELKKEKIT